MPLTGRPILSNRPWIYNCWLGGIWIFCPISKNKYKYCSTVPIVVCITTTMYNGRYFDTACIYIYVPMTRWCMTAVCICYHQTTVLTSYTFLLLFLALIVPVWCVQLTFIKRYLFLLYFGTLNNYESCASINTRTMAVFTEFKTFLF